MRKSSILLLVMSFMLVFAGCKDDETPSLGEAPSDADAAFTYKASADNPNVIEFTAGNSSLTAKWDFGNGQKGEGTSVTSSYPTKGTYTVTLTVFNSGGSNSSSQDIVIDQDDESLLRNPLYTLLTGGVDGPGSKRWVVDSTRVSHFGVGPNPSENGDWPEHWQAPKLAKSNSGLYSDEYVFKISGFGFDHITNGLVFINDNQAGDFPNSYPNADDYSAPFDDQLGETWTIVEGDEDTMLKISGDAFIGFFTGTREYKIVTLAENELTLRYLDSKDPLLAWYIRLVPDDYPIDDGGSGLAEPKVAANDPTAAAGDVISLFSNVYTNVTVNTFKTDWSNSGLEEIKIAGNDVLKYTDLGFVGIETVDANVIDASGMTHVEFDVWTPNSTELKFKIVDFGADGAYQGGDDSEHEVVLSTPNQEEWVHYKVPFSDFTGMTSREHLAQYILVSTPYGTSVVYVDNILFSK